MRCLSERISNRKQKYALKYSEEDFISRDLATCLIVPDHEDNRLEQEGNRERVRRNLQRLVSIREQISDDQHSK